MGEAGQAYKAFLGIYVEILQLPVITSKLKVKKKKERDNAHAEIISTMNYLLGGPMDNIPSVLTRFPPALTNL